MTETRAMTMGSLSSELHSQFLDHNVGVLPPPNAVGGNTVLSGITPSVGPSCAQPTPRCSY